MPVSSHGSCGKSPRYTSVYVAYQMFRQLGLRHLAVLGMDGCLAGILTRKVPNCWGRLKPVLLARQARPVLLEPISNNQTDKVI